jgi:hypothetical protein
MGALTSAVPASFTKPHLSRTNIEKKNDREVFHLTHGVKILSI